jgi:hypothetical protein
LVKERTVPNESLAARESRTWTRYLVGHDPTDDIVASYTALRPTIPALATATPFDQFLLAVARWSPLATRIADAYSRIFRPTSTLRQALVLQLAILETSPPASDWLNQAAVGSRAGLTLGIAGTMVMFALCFAVACLTIGPVHLAETLLRRRPTAAPAR